MCVCVRARLGVRVSVYVYVGACVYVFACVCVFQCPVSSASILLFFFFLLTSIVELCFYVSKKDGRIINKRNTTVLHLCISL